jgi:hypothetical protein
MRRDQYEDLAGTVEQSDTAVALNNECRCFDRTDTRAVHRWLEALRP